VKRRCILRFIFYAFIIHNLSTSKSLIPIHTTITTTTLPRHISQQEKHKRRHKITTIIPTTKITLTAPSISATTSTTSIPHKIAPKQEYEKM